MKYMFNFSKLYFKRNRSIFKRFNKNHLKRRIIYIFTYTDGVPHSRCVHVPTVPVSPIKLGDILQQLLKLCKPLYLHRHLKYKHLMLHYIEFVCHQVWLLMMLYSIEVGFKWCCIPWGRFPLMSSSIVIVSHLRSSSILGCLPCFKISDTF